MRAVVQRVTEAKVTVDNDIVGSIEKGLVVLVGVEEGDTTKDADYMAEKVVGLRIFEDDDDKMNLSVIDKKGKVLAVSQFTLHGDVRKGKRPSFITAARSEEAKKLYEYFVEKVESLGVETAKGIFQADMLVEIHNDGPVTILLDSRKLF